MDSLLHTEEEEDVVAAGPAHQAFWFFLHALLALLAWAGLMFAGDILHPQISQTVILLLSFAVPLIAGNLINRARQDDMATLVWLIGMIWILMVSLWVLDMPTGPNECFQCDATDKLTRTFFSLPRPSGLIDNDGPFLGTWPTAALIGYSIGARLALRRRS
jgi:hypothetical protein